MRIIKRLKHVFRSVQIDCKCVSHKMSQANEDDSITTNVVALCVCVWCVVYVVCGVWCVPVISIAVMCVNIY